MYVVQLDDGRLVRRHIDHMRLGIPVNPVEMEATPSEQYSQLFESVVINGPSQASENTKQDQKESKACLEPVVADKQKQTSQVVGTTEQAKAPSGSDGNKQVPEVRVSNRSRQVPAKFNDFVLYK